MSKEHSRRSFLGGALATSLAANTALAQGQPAAARLDTPAAAGQASGPNASDGKVRAEVTFPRVHTGAALARVSCPLGGIGTGGIGLGGRGNLTDWQIFNRPDIGNALEYSFASIYVKTANQPPFSSVLERRLLPPYDLQQEGLGFANAPGLPRFREATFRGSFPLSHIDFEDDACPVQVALDAFSPFYPVDADASGLPCTVLTYQVHNPGSAPAEAVIAWALSNPVHDTEKHATGEDGRKNEVRSAGTMTALSMTDPTLPADDPMHGSFVIAALADAGARVETLPRWRGGSGWRVGPQHFWFEAFSKDGSLGAPSEPSVPVGCISMRRTIAPGTTASFRFMLTWHFPNRTPDRMNWQAPKGKGASSSAITTARASRMHGPWRSMRTKTCSGSRATHAPSWTRSGPLRCRPRCLRPRPRT